MPVSTATEPHKEQTLRSSFLVPPSTSTTTWETRCKRPLLTRSWSPVDFADADVKFKSSDGVLFRVHRKNLEVCTEGFPPSEISSKGEVVELTETSVTLELLFQFMYPQRHPALDTTLFEVLEPLAEAAEKYQVFPVMNICHIRMRDMVDKHTVEIMVYAMNHDYPYLISEVAPMMIAIDSVKVVEMLPQNLILPWVRYVKEWANVLQNHAISLPIGCSAVQHSPRPDGSIMFNSGRCALWAQLLVEILQRLGGGVHVLPSLDEVFNLSTPPLVKFRSESCCMEELKKWRSKIEVAIRQIPQFSTFL
ncbi:hypothetical protein MSAN_00492000 [Mycena sanguinolenta]|uniref:BTB domain-containing protein n=1 Tax=Mycena sanguinolenta TaxID=230812 RepID=A0A8H6Z917_9AGAR|nr:hypothetical protein MSAN_00492000 [Mycena sanguinolenta]